MDVEQLRQALAELARATPVGASDARAQVARRVARRRRHLAGLASAIGLPVLAAVVAVVLTLAPGSPTHLTTTAGPVPSSHGGSSPGTPPTRRGPPAGGPPPAGMLVASFSFVNPELGWALGEVPCGKGECLAMARTPDGGHSWVSAPVPRARLAQPLTGQGPNCVTEACVSQVRFANRLDGYLFGPALFVTVDGGRTWRRERAPEVVTLAASGANVVRVVAACPGPSCRDLVETARAGSEAWATLPAPPETWEQLVASGAKTLYLRGDGNLGGHSTTPPGSDLWRSLDGGGTWAHLHDPCAPAGVTGVPIDLYGRAVGVAAQGNALGVLCTSLQTAPQQAGYQQGVALSSDSGTRFGPVRAVPIVGVLDGGSGVSGLALASGTTMAVISSEGGVQSSFDGGRTWVTTVARPPGQASEPFPAPLGFETSTEGHAVTPDTTIWTTADGGRHWASYRFGG